MTSEDSPGPRRSGTPREYADARRAIAAGCRTPAASDSLGTSASSRRSEYRGGSPAARARNPSATSSRSFDEPAAAATARPRSAHRRHPSPIVARCDRDCRANRSSRARKLSHRTRQPSPTSRPRLGVRRRSALSTRNNSRYSAREVNIRYGSKQPCVIRSSTIIPMYPSLRADGERRRRASTCSAAFAPAINPWAPASS